MSDENWGLALSGGGFRATLFHLGVIRALRDTGRLRSIRHITSVSGGSIIAAHLVLHWERYNGSETEFEEVADHVVRFVSRDVRGGIIREWLFRHAALVPLVRWKSARLGTLLQRRYEALFENHWMGMLERPDASAPHLSILATSFTTGRLCAFTPRDVVLGAASGEPKVITAHRTPINVAVAASSAFPPLFSPVPLTRAMLHVPEEEFSHTQYLGDGGVYDNVGVRTLAWLQSKEARFDRVVLSDAGAKIDTRVNVPYSFVISRSVRATDVLMQRVSDLEYDGVAARFGIDEASVIRLRIDDELSYDAPHAQIPEVQRAAARVRTDLDAFSPLEINVLVRHGFALTAHALHSRGLGSMPTPPAWLPERTRAAPLDPPDVLQRLEQSAALRWRIWSSRDLASWGLAAIMLLIVTGLSAPFIREQYLRQQVVAAKTQVADAQREHAATFAVLLRSEAETPRVSPAQTPFDRLVADTLDFRQSIVRVQNERGHASGFFISGDGYIMTVDHGVPRNSQVASVRRWDGTVTIAEVIFRDSTLDVALLKIAGVPATRAVPIQWDPPEPATPIFVVGYLFEADVSANAGSVESIDGEKLRYRTNAVFPLPGTSGGPVVTANGRVVAVHSRRVGGDGQLREGTQMRRLRGLVDRYVPRLRTAS